MEAIYVAADPAHGEPFISTPDPSLSPTVLAPQQMSTIDSFLWQELMADNYHQGNWYGDVAIESVLDESLYDRSERQLIFEEL